MWSAGSIATVWPARADPADTFPERFSKFEDIQESLPNGGVPDLLSSTEQNGEPVEQVALVE